MVDLRCRAFPNFSRLLQYLRANGFKTFIVSGGGVEFMRPWADTIYGIPPEQVIGSSVKTKLEIRSGRPALLRLPDIDFVDDRDGKPVAIQRFIGRRPILAFGNSDGDLQMLQWTAAAFRVQDGSRTDVPPRSRVRRTCAVRSLHGSAI